jgi:hypothetical protein
MRCLTKILRKITPEEIREKLERRGYPVSTLGLILIEKGNYEDNLGDIRVSERQVVVSPSNKNMKSYLLKLKTILNDEGIPYRYKGNH